MNNDTLSDIFIKELFHCAFKNDSIFEVLVENLKYSYLVNDYEKKFWKKSIQLFKHDLKVPSLGRVQVEFRKDVKVKDFIVEIRELEDIDEESTLEALQEFIKESKFVSLFESSGELYNKGEQSQAYKVFQEGAKELNSFSIKDKVYKKVFQDFEQRNLERQIKKDDIKKVPFMIDALDEHTRGGAEGGETVLFTAESGIGKSQALIHYAIQTARRGGRVAVFQLEGTEKQVMDRIDAAWTGSLYYEIKNGQMEHSKMKKIKKVIEKIRGEIYVEAFEKFGSASLTMIKNNFREMQKLYGEFDLVVIDYLELLEVDDGEHYTFSSERFRQQKIGRFMKELAMSENVVVATCTQASNLPLDLKNDPDFVMTREFLSEDKGKIRPFDYHFTFNQTMDENKNKDDDGNPAPILRIFEDKMREHRAGRIVTIVTNFARSRFYDRQKTLSLIMDYEDEE